MRCCLYNKLVEIRKTAPTVCPTWPEQALRANILAQISLALNRIWTEWYPSRGYSFNITGSPGVDQAYVSGRTVFAVMEKLTAELFNTYVRRSGDREPYYTEYCDGKTVTCPGMKQWGTVDRAKEGKNALQILRYYYGSRVELVTTNNIASIPSSYPGSPLRRGSTGTNVRIIQRQLSRIAKDYPFFGKPTVNGIFDETTENVVKKFQKQFSLTANGVVGKSTWFKISYIYVSVKDLAELTSEGETADGTQSTGGWPGTTLRRGSTGSNVEQVQFWLSDLAQFDSSLPAVTVDGSYGAATERAVKVFQQKQSLTADGVVGQTTWNALYAAWLEAQSDLGGTAWPGTALRRGSTGMEVRLVQFWLRLAADNYSGLSHVTVDGSYGPATVRAVTAFQNRFSLAADGVTGRSTWNKLKEVALAVANKIVDYGVAPGQFTATVRQGSSGTAVRAVQSLPAAAGGLLQRCAHRDGGRHLWHGDHPRGACLAGAGGPDRGRCRRPPDLAEHLRRCAGLGDQRPCGTGGGSYLPHQNAETRRQRPGNIAAEPAAAVPEPMDTRDQLFGRHRAVRYL